MPVPHRIATLILLSAIAIAYWCFVARADHVAEPWDGARYWTLWYPLSLALSAAAGAVLRRRGWIAGAAITFGQIPLLLRNDDLSLLPLGLGLIALLALPAIAASEIASRLRSRMR